MKGLNKLIHLIQFVTFPVVGGHLGSRISWKEGFFKNMFGIIYILFYSLLFLIHTVP